MEVIKGGNEFNAEKWVCLLDEFEIWDGVLKEEENDLYAMLDEIAKYWGTQAVERREEKKEAIFSDFFAFWGLKQEEIESLPPYLALVMKELVHASRCSSGFGASDASLVLSGKRALKWLKESEAGTKEGFVRPEALELDAAAAAKFAENGSVWIYDDSRERIGADVKTARFVADRRLEEVEENLQTDSPVIMQNLEHLDEELRPSRIESFMRMSMLRTMARCVGNGMLRMRSQKTGPETFKQVPRLCLDAVDQATGKKTSFVPDMHANIFKNVAWVWPKFHNGVVAALRLERDDTDGRRVELFTRLPEVTVTGLEAHEAYAEHAGYMFGSALNGNFTQETDPCVFHDVLVKIDERLSLAVVLGLAVQNIGQPKEAILRLVSLHMDSLCKDDDEPILVPHLTRVAACHAIGLIQIKSRNYFYVEKLLNDINGPPVAEFKNGTVIPHSDRECLNFSAGISIGNIFLASMNFESESTQNNILQPLRLFIGGRVKELDPHIIKKHLTKKSDVDFQTRTHKQAFPINRSTAIPGATLALGLMYLKSRRGDITRWLRLPDNEIDMQNFTPNHVFYHILASNLIFYQDIQPTIAWINSLIPQFMQNLMLCSNHFSPTTPWSKISRSLTYNCLSEFRFLIDPEAIWLHIILAASFSLALKYSGSCDAEAYGVLKDFYRGVQQMYSRENAGGLVQDYSDLRKGWWWEEVMVRHHS